MSTITETALVARIRRRLALDGCRLVKLSDRSRWSQSYGPYMIADESNTVTAYQCDLEDLGRKLGVLRNGEVLA